MSSVIDNGGAAFPVLQQEDPNGNVRMWAEPGMSLRDYFAAKAPTDEVQEILFRHLSPDAQEAVTGLKRPVDKGSSVHAERIAFQLAELEFKCAVNAAIRFKLADAMLKARQA